MLSGCESLLGCVARQLGCVARQLGTVARQLGTRSTKGLSLSLKVQGESVLSLRN